MRRKHLALAAVLLSSAAGCSQYMGPLQSRQQSRADAPAPDGRPYTLAEQEARGRQRYTIPDNSWSSGPATYSGVTGPGYGGWQYSTGH
jgi:hypothetical protein